ncbi:MAG: glycoside hydrolase family 2 protein, partial [Lachnospiraceae bacterium]|nr:glycoside hydrolase family 2 protein [Lachnospiraceae bacterium]
MGNRIWLDDQWGFTEEFTEDLTKKEYTGTLKTVRLPHTCKEVPLHYFDESLYQMVCGYRRILTAPTEWAGKRVILTFEGVGHVCRVFLNGEQIGGHSCGYTAFSVELTERLRLGEENVIALEVDSRESRNVPPFGYVIDYMTFGGIYRDVYLEVFEEAYLEDVFLSTVVSDEHRVRSRVKVNSLALRSVLADMAEATVQYEIRQFLRRKGQGDFVPLGEKKLSYEADAEKRAKHADRFDGDEGIFGATDHAVDGIEALGEIALWDINDPALYELKTQLFQGEMLLDERVDVFGFRSAKFRRDGFYLNGRKVKIRGLNRHQSYPYLGYAAPKSLQVNDADILKYELGVNAVRTSHYPQSHYFIDRCDELGLLVFTEMPGWQHIGDGAW